MLRYEIVDVFTSQAFAGNPLAIVFGADGLSGEQMLKIAKEFNLSETSFVLAPTDDQATYRARIFTPAQELPYAGHPSIGTAVTLARHGDIGQGESIQECGAGLLSVVVDGDFATLSGGAVTCSQPSDPAPLLAAAALTPDDVHGNARYAGTGLEHGYLPVKPDAVARAKPAESDSKVYVYAFDATTRVAHARLFAREVGVVEDPATGSAALGLGVQLVAEGLLPGEGTSSYVVNQGAEIGRPSVLECEVDASGGSAQCVRVRGQVVPVAKGELVAGL